MKLFTNKSTSKGVYFSIFLTTNSYPNTTQMAKNINKRIHNDYTQT